jgi:hypothetical protein
MSRNSRQVVYELTCLPRVKAMTSRAILATCNSERIRLVLVLLSIVTVSLHAVGPSGSGIREVAI